jgi:hypothetical protein
MRLLSHVPARTGVPYERTRADAPEPIPEGAWETVDKKNEDAFYEAIAGVYAELAERDARGEDVGDASRSFLRGVGGALAEHGLEGVARGTSLVAGPRADPIARALRKCVAAHLDKHFDALFDSSRATKENRDALFHMYNTAWPAWRETRRHARGGEAPEERRDAFENGKERLRAAAMMYIEQRLKTADQRTAVSALEANIAAHLFRAFLYLYKGSPAKAEFASVYGPDADTFERSSGLLAIRILDDGKGTFYQEDSRTLSVHKHGDGEVHPVHDGDAPLGAQQAFEKRVRIVGGSTPLHEARRSGSSQSADAAFSETTGLMQRGAKFLRPLSASGAEFARWEKARERARNAEDAERMGRRAEWREHWREEAGGEQRRRRRRNRTVDGQEIWGGYPRGRTSGAAPTPPKPWKWTDLEADGRDAELQKAERKLVMYGKMYDERNRPKARGVPKYHDSWWEWRHNSATSARSDDREATSRRQELQRVQDRMAKRVWYDTYGKNRVYKDANGTEQVAGLPKYKKVVLDRSDAEVGGLANRRMLVKRWMLGHMRRPTLADGSTPRNHSELRCQAARHFVNNYPILEHPNLEYALSFCDAAQQRAVEDEYADFMAAERRLLMNVLRKVPPVADDNEHRDMLEQAYYADSASFARCAPGAPGAPAASTSKGRRTLPALLLPSFFARTFKPGGQKEYGLGASKLPLPRWAAADGTNYQLDNANASMKHLKGYNKRQAAGKAARYRARRDHTLTKDTGCEELEGDDPHWTQLGRITTRLQFPEQTKNGARKLVPMPDKKATPSLYNAALVRLLEFHDEIHPLEGDSLWTNKTHDWDCDDDIDDADQARIDALKARKRDLTEDEQTELRGLQGQPPQAWRHSFWADPLVARPRGGDAVPWLVALKATGKCSKFVTSSTSTVVELVIKRLLEYGRQDGAREAAFCEDDAAWSVRAKTINQANGKGAVQASTLADAFYTSLLTAFPEAKKHGGREINSIMEFIRWFHLHVWRPWGEQVQNKPGKRAFRSVLSQLVGIPDINTTLPLKKTYDKIDKETQKPTGKPDWVEWEKTAYEATLFLNVQNYMDRLWEAVTFTKMALDFAVVDRDSPLRQTDELRAVLDAWIAMTEPKQDDALADAETDAEDELVPTPGDAADEHDEDDSADDAGADGV